MLSIIVYGRNDSHGYNLHKRAAISLNCMAQMLTDDDDEIIFVDYNTPDDLPTFPEAIQDTLTPEARRRMRILRVRPQLHDRLAGLTHLVALEPHSRNAAIRRANPANRWVLSTNPDMIFTPRHDGLTLTSMCSGLADGWYHLPRFELPEALWESFDRLDPVGTIDRLRGDAWRFHLNEITYGNDTILYDAPGDFQLFLRTDLEAIHGFDERMVSGWHVDSNIAHRMRLLRGNVGTAVDGLFGYHCDHTRMASVGHGRDRVENDMRRFILDVDQPSLPQQAEDWGLNGCDLEEFRLGTGRSSLVSALEQVLSPMAETPTEARYTLDTYNDLAYNADHVLPYLADLLLSLPRSTQFAWVGARTRPFHLFRRLIKALGFSGEAGVPRSCAGVAEGLNGVDLRPDADILTTADVFIFEFGAVNQDKGAACDMWDADNLTQLASVRRLFLDFVDAERLAIEDGARPRRVIALNAIGNPFEQVVHDAVSVNRTPHNTRLKQGFVIAQPRQKQEPLIPALVGQWLGQAMGRRHAVPITESVRLLSCLSDCLDGATSAERHLANAKAAAPLLTLLDYPGVVSRTSADRLDVARRTLERNRPSAQSRPHAVVPVQAPDTLPSQAPCRLANVEDWEDDAFLRFARRYFTGTFAANWFRRSAGLWVRLAVLTRLEAEGILNRNARVLVVMTGLNDGLCDALSTCVGHVDILDMVPPDIGPFDRLPPTALRDPARLSVVAAPREGSYDAVVFPRGAAFHDGDAVQGASRLLAAAAALRPGGVLVFAERLRIDGPPAHGRLDVNRAFSPAAVEVFRDLAGLEMLPVASPSLSAPTLDLVAADRQEELWPHMVVRQDDGLQATAIWFLRRLECPIKADTAAQMAQVLTGGDVPA
ncbi:MAG: hypothetical protein H7X89_00085 [Rhizobiales bacterium]|nr:hypothetical protein [Hyphomicrobiales bacterium]